MSELTITKPDVFSGYTDILCTTSIEHVVIGRNSALKQIEALIQQIDDISTLISNIGGGKANE